MVKDCRASIQKLFLFRERNIIIHNLEDEDQLYLCRAILSIEEAKINAII